MKKTVRCGEKDRYRFISDQEPSDEQLNQLMKEVADEVVNKAREANAQFQQQLKELCIAKRKQQGLI